MKKGKVIKIIDSETLVINLGTDHHVANGDRFQVFGIGEPVIDPDTEENLGELEIFRGTGKIIHAQPKFSTIKSDMQNSPAKTIRKRNSPGGQGPQGAQALIGLSAISRQLLAEFQPPEQPQYKEEYLPVATMPFDSPIIGDSVRPI